MKQANTPYRQHGARRPGTGRHWTMAFTVYRSFREPAYHDCDDDNIIIINIDQGGTVYQNLIMTL